MTADNQASLSFSLKESVWFQKGQEVDQLLSISLDPDIVIHDRDYEVVVKGHLHLTGEYVPTDQEEASYSLRELSPVRTVDYVHVREDGVNELAHSFPLEISIPRSRVQDVESVYVEIETFDYELPENGCLQLLAEIAIYGLSEPEREEAVQEEETVAPVEEEEFLFEPFEFEVRKEPTLQREQELEKQEKPKQEKKEEIAPLLELFGRPEPELPQPEKREPEKKQKAAKEEEPVYSQRDENALYLTRLFGKNPQEEFTKLRMYFVQAGDTMESIASRYDTNSQHLLRINRLDDSYVSQGQVIYVPAKAKTKS